jgi:hypothetical protein
MRVWDLHPGYLDRQNLLGEHNEIHGLLTIIGEGRRGYAQHPETMRWREHLPALHCRHDLVVAEMRLRGYQHRSPAGEYDAASLHWPAEFLDPPARQFMLLAERYARRGSPGGRIPIPRSAQELWAQHKYSVLARSPEAYQDIGRRAANPRSADEFDALALELTHWLRRPPAPGRLINALQHMWGYVSPFAEGPAPAEPAELLKVIQSLAFAHHVTYLLESTALSDLAGWLDSRISQRG